MVAALCLSLIALGSPPSKASPTSELAVLETTDEGVTILTSKDVGLGAALTTLSDGTRVLAPRGSTITVDSPSAGEDDTEAESEQTEVSMVDGADGADPDVVASMTVSVQPPEPTLQGSVMPPASELEFVTLASALGFIPRHVLADELRWAQEQTSNAEALLPSTSRSSAAPRGTTYLDGKCVDAGQTENSTGRVAGCGYRYRHNSSSTAFGVRHWASGQSHSIYALRRVFSGADYRGTGRVREFSPKTHFTENCRNFPVTATYLSVGVTAEFRACDKHGPNNGSDFFYGDWRGRVGRANAREGYGAHHFTRPSGTQSGYRYRLHFYAI